jgi:predicted ATPase
MAIAKWRNIDFHTHTPASNDFKGRDTVTPEEWIKAASDSGLDAVVITDHNSVDWIHKLRAVKQKELFIFPGIEICYGDAFAHILIIFDPALRTNEIQDMTIEMGLSRDVWGDTEKNVNETNFMTFFLKYKGKFLLVPAHFGTTKGLANSLPQAGVKKFFNKYKVDAIEVRNDKDFEQVSKKINSSSIPKIALISGSDNPDSSNGHSIKGFGKTFTKVKIGEYTLEALRQAFLDYDSRIAYVINGNANLETSEVCHNYISGIIIKNLTHVNELDLRFSPHLNCIIGGRGTGKSTLIEMIRYCLENNNQESNRRTDGIGLLNTITATSEIDLFYEFGGNTSYLLNSTNSDEGLTSYVKDENGLATEFPKFDANVYSQKELFRMVETDNDINSNSKSPLMNIIDENIDSKILKIRNDINDVKRELVDVTQRIKNNKIRLAYKSTLLAEQKVLEEKINNIKESGVLETRKKLENSKKPLDNIFKQLTISDETVDHSINNINDIISQLNDVIIETNLSSKEDALFELREFQESSKIFEETFKIKMKNIKNLIENCNEYNEVKGLSNKYDLIKKELDKKILDSIQNIENEMNNKTMELNDLRETEKENIRDKQRYQKLIDNFFVLHERLTVVRKEKIDELNDNIDNIRLEIHSMGHKERWLSSLKNILSKEGVFDKDFQQLMNYLFDGKTINTEKYRDWLNFILLESSKITFNGLCNLNDQRFLSIWKDRIESNTLSALINIELEDKIEINIVDEGGVISINEGSPGQKTAAILAFILHQGNAPIIIDQPEDDLDNSLIMDLIVTCIRKLKTKRQIIIATHNANIPVLGDAEGIVILERNNDGKVSFRENKKTGCLEEIVIKNGICDIMEGGISAFKKREQKYKYMM